MRTVLLASTIALLGLTSTAEAHFILKTPVPSNPTDSLPGQNGHPNTSNEASGKGPPPCGPDSTPSTMPTAVQGGHTLHLDVEETTFHPGWYRIALSVNSRSELPPDPTVYDSSGKVLDPAKASGTSASADKELPAAFPILASDVWDHTTPPTKDWVLDLPIPNFDCPKCTLQIEQFMDQHPSNVGIGGFFYHHCADINVTADPSMPLFVPGTDGGVADAATGDSKADGSVAGMGGGGAGGAGGNATGSGGSAGSSVAGGSGSNGGAGNGVSGGSGTSGSAGAVSGGGDSGSTGASGAAGTSGARGNSSGGCDYAGGYGNSMAVPVLLLLAVISWQTLRMRRRRS